MEEVLTAPFPEQTFLDAINGQIFISNKDICSVLKGKTGFLWKHQVVFKDAYKLVFYEKTTGRYFDIKTKQTTKSDFFEHALENMNWFDTFIHQQTQNGTTEYQIPQLKVSFSLPERYDKLIKSYFRSFEIDMQHPENLVSYFATPKTIQITQAIRNQGRRK